VIEKEEKEKINNYTIQHNKTKSIGVNDIMCKLSTSQRSCHVAGIYVGVLMYADGLLLISSHE